MSNEIDALRRRLERLEAVQEIQNLMGRRAFLHSAGMNDREFEECWSTRDDICFEAEDWGVWDGREAIIAAYVKENPFPSDTVGLMIEHCLTTQVIEVAEDGQTAKGVWISPGHETFPIVPGEPPKPHWSWGRYSVDFVKEDGQWRVWHLHVLTTFRTPYDRSWVDAALNRPEYFPEEGATMEGMTPPTRPVTFNQPYHPDKAPAYQPVPPRRYRDWSETTSYTDPL
ncbi:nuclear transport factor 2 family protein [Streptomyces sp. AS02]|uniref:nuclear transport factor 2 family protein n=1 Tax=Streptomyces sp. AS02 TaxID=2938946 RepID=UPI002021A189|nr:nuclear transport factor 2 family protein [Streptomyces sp. AS02]MCL8017257.1 nuclear transport factor 2 family protein [Streptomyces sp. AS02]